MRSVSIRTIVVCLLAFGLGVGLRLALTGAPDGDAAFETATEQIMAAPITLVAPRERAPEAQAIVFGAFREVDRDMSEWKDTSPLSGVNRAAGREPAPVPDDLRALLRRAVEIGDMTEGAFDVTWAALWGVWDFKSPTPTLPDAEEIERRVRLVDYERVQIDDAEGTVYLPEEGIVLGLGGIAKGYALDLAAERLRDAGVSDFLISAAGQVMVGGQRGDRPWRIGVRDPRGAPDDYFAFIEITDTSLSTSGDYERFFFIDGVRYHHILDPRTGWPARGARGVTVICPDATLADALSTAMLILDPHEAIDLANGLDDVEVILVTENGQLLTSDGLDERLEVLRDPTP